MKNILITGASRGLGLEITKQELERNNFVLTRKKDINISTIASRENKEISYICKILNLVFLAPDIKKAILTNNTKLGLTLLDLYDCKNLDWASQRRKLGVIGY